MILLTAVSQPKNTYNTGSFTVKVFHSSIIIKANFWFYKQECYTKIRILQTRVLFALTNQLTFLHCKSLSINTSFFNAGWKLNRKWLQKGLHRWVKNSRINKDNKIGLITNIIYKITITKIKFVCQELHRLGYYFDSMMTLHYWAT